MPAAAGGLSEDEGVEGVDFAGVVACLVGDAEAVEGAGEAAGVVEEGVGGSDSGEHRGQRSFGR